MFCSISPTIPLPTRVEELTFLTLTILLLATIIFKLFVRFSISSISSLDLCSGSLSKAGCRIKLISLFTILIVPPPNKHL